MNQQRRPRAARPRMPAYGIAGADKGKGLLPWEWAVQRLSESRNYWVSTACAGGRPHSMPVWGVWSAGAFYFSTARESRKARNLANDPRCVIAPETADQAVILEGRAREEKDPALLARVFKLYQDKYKWKLDGSEGPIFAVLPEAVYGFISPGLGESATRWTF